MEIYRSNNRGGYNRTQSARNISNCNQSSYNQSSCNKPSCNQLSCNKPSCNQPSCNSQNDNHPAHHDSDCSTQFYNAPLAMTFIHMQNWCETYPPEKAICEGTIFPSLNLIFCGSRGKVK